MRISDWSSDVCSSDLRKEIAQRKVKADAEHQQDDAKLGQFQRQFAVGDKAGGERADGNTSEQIARDRRDEQPLRQRAENEGHDQSHDDGPDQWRFMVHAMFRWRERKPADADSGSEEHTSALQHLMRTSYADFCF